MYLLIALISLFAAGIGAICGFGGGVIIQPLLSTFDIFDVAQVSFLSSVTVLSMTTYSVVRSRVRGGSRVDGKIGLAVAAGASIGGLLGRQLFVYAIARKATENYVGAIQAIILLILTVGTVIYTLNMKRIKSYQVTNIAASIITGIVLGAISAFLGIGGGPINLIVLFFIFSMNTKTAVETSLYIIFFSQVTNISTIVITNDVPDFTWGVLIIMMACGILGGIVGRKVNEKISTRNVERLFIAVMICLSLVNAYNVVQFL